MKSQKTKCIVLKRTNYGEADRILQILTAEGKKSVMARGVRREKSRLAGGIELFSLCEVSISSGKGDIYTLTSSRMEKFFGHIIEDYDRMEFGYQVVKLISNASEMIDSAEWYDVILSVFYSLDDKKTDINLIKLWFYLRYEKLLGYELGLYYDDKGNKIEAQNRYYYDINEKSLSMSENGKITSSHIKLMRVASSVPITTLIKIGGIENDMLNDCLDVVKNHASI